MVRRSIYITTSGRIRSIGSTGRTSNTSTARRVTKNSIRGDACQTPTSRSIARIIVAVLAIPSFLLIIELLLHILKVVLLLKSHFLLFVLPIAASLDTAKESIRSTGSDITNSTSGSRAHQTAKTTESVTEIRHIVLFFFRKVGEGRASALRNIYQVYCGPPRFSLFN